MNFSDFAYYGFKFVEKSVNLIPKNVLINGIGNLAYRVDNKRKKDIFVNLNLAFPKKSFEEKEKIAKNVYKNFARNLIEFIQNKNLSQKKLLEKVEFVGFEKLTFPVIFVTAHFGNWEILPLAIGSKGIKVNIVYRKVDNEKLNEEIIKSRKRFNVDIIEKRGALKNLMKALKNKESVGILVDQNTAKNEGVETTFFEKRVLQTPSAAILSKKFNIPIAMIFAIPKKNLWQITIKDIFYTEDIQESVNRQSKIIEEVVKEYPDEYYWFHKRFKHFYEEEYKKVESEK